MEKLKTQFIKGSTVKIYEDPITRKVIEGKARLLKHLNTRCCRPYLESWTVKFQSDGFVCDRRIMP